MHINPDELQSQALQCNDRGSSLTSCCETSELLRLVRTPLLCGHSAQIHWSTGSTSFSVVLFSQPPHMLAIYPTSSTSDDMTKPPEPISFQKQLLLALAVVYRQVDTKPNVEQGHYKRHFSWTVRHNLHFHQDHVSFLTNRQGRWLNQHAWQTRLSLYYCRAISVHSKLFWYC